MTTQTLSTLTHATTMVVGIIIGAAIVHNVPGSLPPSGLPEMTELGNDLNDETRSRGSRSDFASTGVDGRTIVEATPRRGERADAERVAEVTFRPALDTDNATSRGRQ